MIFFAIFAWIFQPQAGFAAFAVKSIL